MAENKKKFKINFFDIVIILIVVCVGAGVYFFTHKSPAAATKKLTYVVELNKTTPGLEDYIRIGDDLTENTKNYNMGKVVDVETVPYSKITPTMKTMLT